MFSINCISNLPLTEPLMFFFVIGCVQGEPAPTPRGRGRRPPSATGLTPAPNSTPGVGDPKRAKRDRQSEGEASDMCVCPEPTCCKSFRKASLLEQHIKHYHPKLKLEESKAPRAGTRSSTLTPGSDPLGDGGSARRKRRRVYHILPCLCCVYFCAAPWHPVVFQRSLRKRRTKQKL